MSSQPDTRVLSTPTPSSRPGVARTEAEVSLLLPSSVPRPAGARGEPHRRGWRVQGPLAFELVGILAELAQALAQAGISLLAVSTFDTDYIFVRAAQAQAAEAAWQAAGWRVVGRGEVGR